MQENPRNIHWKSYSCYLVRVLEVDNITRSNLVTYIELVLRCIFREEVGPDAARKFLGHTQWLVNYWLLQQGFSIGIGDTIADAETMDTINETISKAKEEVKKLIRDAQDKKLEPEPGRTMMESFENRVNQV